MFEKGFGHVSTVDVPQSITVTGVASSGASLTVEMSFDQHLFRPGGTAVASCGSRIMTAPVTPITGGCRFEIRVPPGRGDVVVLLPLTVVSAYPHEDVGPVSPAVVTVSTAAGVVATLRANPSAPIDAITAGAELEVGWASTVVRDQGRKANYRVPSLIRCTSVGPLALPVGTMIEIATDKRLASPPRVVSVILDGRDLGVAALERSVNGRILRQRRADSWPRRSPTSISGVRPCCSSRDCVGQVVLLPNLTPETLKRRNSAKS
ncbi:hypothetical protein AX769_07550 [Frondihabitans sp. PAMC 28766]|nr:hypothetical protein AX769_07550 [Frondihabitans sp. PAMC 28766]